MSSELNDGLSEIERWVDEDPTHLLNYLGSEQGFSSFWQLIVAAEYADDKSQWKRLEAAAERLSRSAGKENLATLVEQVLAKAETVCGITNEVLLLASVRSLCLLLSPSSSLQN
jgi:hypothetical protein